jgi:hypothetical protein
MNKGGIALTILWVEAILSFLFQHEIFHDDDYADKDIDDNDEILASRCFVGMR